MNDWKVVHSLELERTLEPFGTLADCLPGAPSERLSVNFVQMKPLQRIAAHRHDDQD